MNPHLTDEQQLALSQAVKELLPEGIAFIMLTFPYGEEDIDPNRAPRKMTVGFTSNAPIHVALKVSSIFGDSAKAMLPDENKGGR